MAVLASEFPAFHGTDVLHVGVFGKCLPAFDLLDGNDNRIIPELRQLRPYVVVMVPVGSGVNLETPHHTVPKVRT